MGLIWGTAFTGEFEALRGSQYKTVPASFPDLPSPFSFRYLYKFIVNRIGGNNWKDIGQIGGVEL